MGSLARRVGGSDAEVTEPGEWGPWVDGGAWLSVDGTSVDWIYRDLDRVQTAWAQAQQGQFTFNTQTGHPFGVPDFAYAGEVALGVVLDDPSGQLNAMKLEAGTYPPALAEALIERLWEADFCSAVFVSRRREPTPCGSPDACSGWSCCASTPCTGAPVGGLINEKGAVTSTGGLAVSPFAFADRARTIMSRIGTTQSELANTLEAATELVAATRAAVR